MEFQGCEDTERHLEADDFLLVLMSDTQIAVLQQLYTPNSETAMDSTHGTNAYDYQLTTVMVIGCILLQQ